MLFRSRAKAPLQLIVLETNSRYLTKGWPIWRPPAFPLLYRARLGPRIGADRPLSATVEVLTQHYQQALPVGPFRPQDHR